MNSYFHKLFEKEKKKEKKNEHLYKPGNELEFIKSSENVAYGDKRTYYRHLKKIQIEPDFEIICDLRIHIKELFSEFYVQVYDDPYIFNFFPINKIVRHDYPIDLIDVLKHCRNYHRNGSLIIHIKKEKIIKSVFLKSIWNNYPASHKICHIRLRKIQYNLKINTIKMILNKINLHYFPINDLAPIIHKYI